MKSLIRIACLAVAALTFVATPNGAWAAKGGGGGHHHSGGGRWSGARTGFHHHHHHHSHFYGGFFFGSPFGYPYYPDPYFYGGNPFYRGWPPYYGWRQFDYGIEYSQSQIDPTAVYVEKFSGTPTPETQGEILCPDSGAHYPAVKDCPGGWQRVFRPQASAPPVAD